MKAMVLAAGKGSRLRPLTDHIPKPMIPVNGRPLLEHTVRWLRSHGVADLVINLHHHPEVILKHFGDGAAFGVRISYSFEPELLGTAGALLRCARHFEGEPFLIVYGDNLSSCNLTELAEFHRTKGGIATIAVFRREDVTHSGVADLDSENRITRFIEKPAAADSLSHWVNAGIVVADPSLLAYIPATTPSDVGRDVFPALLQAGERLYAYRMNGGLWWADSLDDYERLQQLAASGAIPL